MSAETAAAGVARHPMSDAARYRQGLYRLLAVAFTYPTADGIAAAAAAARVSVSVTFPSGGVGTAAADTNQSGEVTFVARNAADGCYTTDVTAIDAGGFVFDGSEPLNGFEKGADPTPDEDCRGGGDPCGTP
ncbi:MAG: hypothetical protein IIC93_02255 [Chloroflexi bacterium]|nr:hypothetical protein [Chloroflexota bacterium]